MDNQNSAPIFAKIIGWIVLLVSTFGLIASFHVLLVNSTLSRLSEVVSLIISLAYVISSIGILKGRKWGIFMFVALFIYQIAVFVMQAISFTLFTSVTGALFLPISIFELIAVIYLLVVRKKFV